MGLFKKKNKIGEGNLLKSAYKLGYEIGFHEHNEFWGWVRDSKSTLLKDAKSAGVYDAVVEEFIKGKKEGHLAKETQVKGKRKKVLLDLADSKKRERKELKDIPKKEEESLPKKDLSFLTQIKYSIVERPLHISRATFIELPKLVKMPKFLRVSRSKK